MRRCFNLKIKALPKIPKAPSAIIYGNFNSMSVLRYGEIEHLFSMVVEGHFSKSCSLEAQLKGKAWNIEYERQIRNISLFVFSHALYAVRCMLSTQACWNGMWLWNYVVCCMYSDITPHIFIRRKWQRRRVLVVGRSDMALRSKAFFQWGDGSWLAKSKWARGLVIFIYSSFYRFNTAIDM